jgi:hypothetical protein
LGSCEVNPENMVMEFVNAAAGFLNELVEKSVQKKKVLLRPTMVFTLTNATLFWAHRPRTPLPRTRLTTCRLSRMLEERPRRGRR